MFHSNFLKCWELVMCCAICWVQSRISQHSMIHLGSSACHKASLKASLSLAGNTNPARRSVRNVARCCQDEIVALGNYWIAQSSCDRNVGENLFHISADIVPYLCENRYEMKFEQEWTTKELKTVLASVYHSHWGEREKKSSNVLQ